MCYMHILQVCHPKRGVKTTLPHKRGCPSAKDTITAIIKAIAPPHYPPLLPPDVPVRCSNNPAILEQLQCPICLEILYQPLELPCRALVCTTCLVRWFEAFSCCGVKCPCCFTDTLLLQKGYAKGWLQHTQLQCDAYQEWSQNRITSNKSLGWH